MVEIFYLHSPVLAENITFEAISDIAFCAAISIYGVRAEGMLCSFWVTSICSMK